MRLIVLAAFTAGCAGFGSAGPSVSLHRYGGGSVLDLEPWGIVSSRVHLIATESGYHGMVDRQTAFLFLRPGRVVGVVRELPVDLHISPRDGGIQVSGLFAGRPARVAATPATLAAGVGRCSYNLHKGGSASYEGWSSCGLSPEASIQLPPDFDRLPDHRRAILLVLLLGG